MREMRALRLPEKPIITPESDERFGDNINGPSLIRVPDWAPGRLGRYYLYFAHHSGDFIRLAVADHIAGPWRVHSPGVMDLAVSGFTGHIASPDVHVDEANRRFVMYFHGAPADYETGQASAIAYSGDGLSFVRSGGLVARPYLRVFTVNDAVYGIAIPGSLYWSPDGGQAFQKGPLLFDPQTRHFAVRVRDGAIEAFYSVRGDSPERILVSRVECVGEWTSWRAGEPQIVLEPETDYEGVDLPVEPSVKGRAHGRVRQLRDPAVFEEAGRTWLVYSVAGESGLAIAEIVESTND
ncbi:MAG: hypothetical protein ACOC2D_14705 [Spirochaetota bacterium]